MVRSTSESTRFELERLREDALALSQTLELALHRGWPDVHAFLCERLLPPGSIATGAETSGGYGRVSERLSALIAKLERHEHEARVLALRLVMLSQFQEAGSEHRQFALPNSIIALYPRELRRILDALQDAACIVDLGKDRWKKNLAILTGRLLPVGAEFADTSSGIPRGTLFKGGVIQALHALRCIALETRGFKPMLELHAHPDSLADFSPEGWQASYHRLAELLLLNPRYKGVMAASWFRDPALATISPRLRYLREYPERHGARMFRVGTDTAGTSGALARSPTRQRLFKAGAYVPTIHLMIWPRSALLGWHAKVEAPVG